MAGASAGEGDCGEHGHQPRSGHGLFRVRQRRVSAGCLEDEEGWVAAQGRDAMDSFWAVIVHCGVAGGRGGGMWSRRMRAGALARLGVLWVSDQVILDFTELGPRLVIVLDVRRARGSFWRWWIRWTEGGLALTSMQQKPKVQ